MKRIEFEIISMILEKLYKENKGRTSILGIIEAMQILLDELDERLNEYDF